MWARLLRFSGLPRSAKRDFLRASLFLPLIRISLRLRGFRATQKSLQARLGRNRSVPMKAEADKAAEEVSRMVRAAARELPIASSCLEQAIALWWLLARRRIAAQLRIGARKTGEKFEAHAWVERNGAAIGAPDGAHLHYSAFEKEFSEDLP
jgi:hypothetical protein